MILTPEERAFLVATNLSGAERVARQWHAGDVALARSAVGRLRRARYLYGAPGGKHMSLSEQGRRAIAAGKAPPLGVEIQARGRKRILRGRVIASGPNKATLLPLDGGKDDLIVRSECRFVPAVYEVRRPHAGAPWKGETHPLAHYRDSPLWLALAPVVPAIWTAPFTTEPHTLARLREVAAKLASVGTCYGQSAEEQAAMAITHHYGNPLAGIRATVERAYCAGDMPRNEYLAEVIRRDPEPFDAADYAYAEQEVKRLIWPYRGPGTRGPLTFRSLADVAKDMRHHRPEMVQRAYEALLPWAQKVVDDCEARIAATRARFVVTRDGE